jgi:hypothetical protein
MAIVPPGPCTPISPNINYLVTLYGANGQPSSRTIVNGSNVDKTVQAMQQAYCQSLQQAQQQIQPQVICIQQPNQQQAHNDSSPLWNLVGLISGAFLAISALRSTHLEKGIDHINEFAKETLGDLVKQTRAGLKKLETKLLAPTINVNPA